MSRLQRSVIPQAATVALMLAAVLLASGCATSAAKDYSLFRENMPRSILVLPPLNESEDINAGFAYLSIASEAIGEKGFYVFPVAVVDTLMRENGLTSAADMHALPLSSIDEITGADAVLYITLEQFGQKFEGLDKTTRVRARASLVDVGSGQELWQNTIDHQHGGNRGNASGYVLNTLIAAPVGQLFSSVSDRVHAEARLAHYRLVTPTGRGLLFGPRHPLHGSEETGG